MPRNVSGVTVVTNMNITQLNGTNIGTRCRRRKTCILRVPNVFYCWRFSPVGYNTVLLSYRNFVGLSGLHLQGCSPRRRRHVPEDGDSKLPETSVINRHGVICQNTWFLINTAVETTCVTVLCVLFRISSIASQNNDLPFSTVGMVCVRCWLWWRESRGRVRKLSVRRAGWNQYENDATGRRTGHERSRAGDGIAP